MALNATSSVMQDNASADLHERILSDNDSALSQSQNSDQNNEQHSDDAIEYEVIYEEVISGGPPKRNWRGIAISILVILIISSIVGGTILLLPFARGVKEGAGEPVTFADFLSGALQEQPVRYVWLQDKLLAFHDGISNIGILKIEDNGKINLVEYESYEQTWISSYNADYMAFGVHAEEVMLILLGAIPRSVFYLITQIYRHSANTAYTIVPLKKTSKRSRYAVNTLKSENGTAQKLRLFKWNPVGNDFAFVYQNDIYYRSSPEDPLDSALRVTWNGLEGDDGNDIISGVADWLYEEEIFHNDDAMWWSSDGRYLAFATFNNSQVRRMSVDYYPGPSEDLYPNRRTVAYPKVGERLPGVKLSVWIKESAATVQMTPPAAVRRLREYYLFSVSWPNVTNWNGSEKNPPLLAVWANRAQNLSYITFCNIHTGICLLNYIANADTPKNASIWVEPTDFRMQYADGNRYFAILPSLQTDVYYYKHIASIEIQEDGSAGRVHFLTEGLWEVIQIVGHNAAESLLKSISQDEELIQVDKFDGWTLLQYTPYSVSTSHPSKSSIRCLTCWMEHERQCTNVNAGFSKNGDHYVLTCEGPGIPFVVLRRASTNETIYTITNNTSLTDYVARTALPLVKYESVDLGDGYEAEARLLFPPGYDESRIDCEQFPVIQFVYAGPNSRSVWEQWFGSVAFETYLASSRRYIVVAVDGRGSSNRGAKYKKAIYRNLGTYEIKDQIFAGKALAKKYKAIDQNKMAISGWSYGGFAAIAMVELGAFQLYKCAAAIAPVTDFRYYDAAYIERYMGLYTDPEAVHAYARTNLLANVSQIADGKLLLVHGAADDNVHFQNSAMLAEVLSSRNIPFSYMVYTNGDHSLSESRTHLHTLLDNFFEECFRHDHAQFH